MYEAMGRVHWSAAIYFICFYFLVVILILSLTVRSVTLSRGNRAGHVGEQVGERSSWAGQGRAGQGRAGQGRAGEGRVWHAQSRIVSHCTVLHGTALHHTERLEGAASNPLSMPYSQTLKHSGRMGVGAGPAQRAPAMRGGGGRS